MGRYCASCIRVLMIVFNLLFLLIGVTIVGLGIYLLISGYAGQSDGKPELLYYPLIVLATLGMISVLLALCACWGALCRNKCCLGLYFTSLLLVFACEIAIGIAGVINKDTVRTVILDFLKAAVIEYKPPSPGQFNFVDLIQLAFGCCGYSGSSDYLLKGMSIPPSCCANNYCFSVAVNLASSLPGCKDAAAEIENRTLIICAVIIALAVVQLLGLIFSMVLCHESNKKYTERLEYREIRG